MKDRETGILKRFVQAGIMGLALISMLAACVPFFEGSIEFSGELSFSSEIDRAMVDATATALVPILRSPIPSFTPASVRPVPTRPPLPTLPPPTPTNTLIPTQVAGIMPDIAATATSLAELFQTSPTAHVTADPRAPLTPISNEIALVVLNPGNFNAEGLRIRNRGEARALDDWFVHDEDGNVYTFGQQMFASNAELTLFTHGGQDTPVFLYWGLSAAVWEVGETVSLCDEMGNLIAMATVR